jgi:hypothetical protein
LSFQNLRLRFNYRSQTSQLTVTHPIEDTQRTARRRENLQSARMLAGEDPEQVVIETLRRRDDFADLNFRLDIQIIANVAGLEIEVEKRDFAVLRRRPVEETDGGLDGKRRIADAAGAWDKGNDDGSPSFVAAAPTRPRTSRTSCFSPVSATHSALPD